MEIQFKSEFFKRIFQSDVFTDEMAKTNNLIINRDLQPLLFLTEEIIEDYKMILDNSKGIENIFFAQISGDLIKKFLQYRVNGKKIGIFDTKLPEDLFNGVDETFLAGVEGLSFSACEKLKDKPTKLAGIEKFKNLKELDFLDSDGIDIEDFLSKCSNKDKLEKITLSKKLPNPDIIKDYIGIKSIRIVNVDDPKALKNFLEALPLESLTEIQIMNCNLELLSEDIISRLSNLETLNLTNNSKVNYEGILKVLPNNALKTLEIRPETIEGKDKKEFDIELLKKFSLETLKLHAFKLDYTKFKDSVDNRKLTELFLNDCGVGDLKFLEDYRISNISIFQDDIDFAALTPELAKNLKNVRLLNTKTQEKVMTRGLYRDKDDRVHAPEITFNIIDSSLAKIEQLLKNISFIGDAEIELTEGDTQKIRDFAVNYGKKMRDGYGVKISDFSKLTIEQAEFLSQDGLLRTIRTCDKEEQDEMIPKRFSYTPEQFSELKQIVEEVTKGIDSNMPELQKFMIVYRRLGAAIKYDYGIVGKNQYSKYAKDNFDNCRNMINGLMRKTCVCAGYSDILYNCLREVGIETYKVTGIGGNGWHEWNKVRIDGVLYNTDLTWDIGNLSQECVIDLQHCLIPDRKFNRMHDARFGRKEACTKAISRQKVKQALRDALEFDGIEPKTLFEKSIENLKDGTALKEFKEYLHQLKIAFKEEVIPEFKSLFLRKKALPEPQKNEKENENTDKINNNSEIHTEDKKKELINPWIVSEDIVDKVNAISHANTGPIENLEEREVYDDE